MVFFNTLYTCLKLADEWALAGLLFHFAFSPISPISLGKDLSDQAYCRIVQARIGLPLYLNSILWSTLFSLSNSSTSESVETIFSGERL
ncbi:uncharacterized protein OCT59_020449 [Rhizophagus irregularis]|uniref:uncharacterized protein n=1 Tax=Rhizophagus irregularis TaxID=588596 RepID=UPI000CCAAAE1|nr:hypothetical protein OCT59_020449 [Rhizophagus irregularis]